MNTPGKNEKSDDHGHDRADDSTNHGESGNHAPKAVRKLLMLPSVAVQVLKALENEDCGMGEIVQIILRNPAVSMRILKVANSAIYGRARSVSTVKDAVSMLGMKATRNLVIAVAMDKIFLRGFQQKALSELSESLWQHSILTSAICGMIAAKTRRTEPDVVVLGGLVHDIGTVAEIQCFQSEMANVLNDISTTGKVSGSEFLNRERTAFGQDHQMLGLEICDEWKLPGRLGEMIAFHHQPADAPSEIRDACLQIALADQLAVLVHPDRFIAADDGEVDRIAIDLLKISDRDWTQLRSGIEENRANLLAAFE